MKSRQTKEQNTPRSIYGIATPVYIEDPLMQLRAYAEEIEIYVLAMNAGQAETKALEAWKKRGYSHVPIQIKLLASGKESKYPNVI